MSEIAIVALEESLTNEVDSTFPKQVSLCPIYTRPIFPNIIIRSTTTGVTGLLPPSSSRGKIKQVLDRIKEVGGVSKDTLEGVKLDGPEEANTENVEDTSASIISHGATVIIEKGYIEALYRLKKNGESYVALSLIKPKDGLSTTVDSVYSVGVLARIEHVSEYKTKEGNRAVQIELRGTHRIAITGLAKSQEMNADTNGVKIKRVNIRELRETKYNESSQMCRALTMAIDSRLQQLSRLNHPLFGPQLLSQYNLSTKTPSQLADFVSSLISGTPEQLQKILSQLDVIERMKSVLILLQMENDLSRILFEKNIDGDMSLINNKNNR